MSEFEAELALVVLEVVASVFVLGVTISQAVSGVAPEAVLEALDNSLQEQRSLLHFHTHLFLLILLHYFTQFGPFHSLECIHVSYNSHFHSS